MRAAEERIRIIAEEVLKELGFGAQRFVRSDESVPAREGIQMIAFDMAGTTVRDDDTVLECMMTICERHSLKATPEEVNAFMGASKRWVFEHFAVRQYPGKGDVGDRAYRDFQELLEERYRTGRVEAVEGAVDTFHWLRERGIRIALGTGFYRRVAELLVRRLGWDQGLVDALVTVDDVSRGRPAPFMIFAAMEQLGVDSVRRVVKVGDTPFDLLEGTNAGVRAVIGVLSGAHDAASFGHVRHTHILPSVRELPELLTGGL